MKTVIGVVLMVSATLAYAGGDVQAGEKLVTNTCSGCHGPLGAKPSFPGAPILAGQPADYLEHALGEYKSGARKNPTMGGVAQPLSPEDIRNVAAYLSQQPSSLSSVR